MKHKKSWTTRK